MVKLTPELLYKTVEILIEIKDEIQSYEDGISLDKEKYEYNIEKRDEIKEVIISHLNKNPLSLDQIIYYTLYIKQTYET